MPAYNAGHYIREAIESVLAQTYFTFELIIVDDGSTDDTYKIISSYCDARIRIVRQENMGLGGARNSGIRTACNDYIAFLDADDLWAPNKLKNIVKNYEFGVGVYYTNAYEFVGSISTAIPVRYSEGFHALNDRDKILIYDFIIVSSSVVPRYILHEYNLFSEDLNGTEDWDLWMRIGQIYKFKKINNYDCYYRLNPSGLSKNREIFFLKEYMVIKKNLIDGYLGSSNILKKTLWVWYKKKFYYYLLHFKLLNATLCFIRMLLLNPFSLNNLDFIIKIVRKIYKK